MNPRLGMKSGFPHPLERRRPRHPHPETSQSRVREAAIAGETLPYGLTLPLMPRAALHSRCWGKLVVGFDRTFDHLGLLGEQFRQVFAHVVSR